MGMLARLFARPEAVKVKKVRAARSVFESHDIQRVDIELHLEGDIKVVLELTPELTHLLITQCAAAYIAINPPLRIYNGNAGGFGI